MTSDTRSLPRPKSDSNVYFGKDLLPLEESSDAPTDRAKSQRLRAFEQRLAREAEERRRAAEQAAREQARAREEERRRLEERGRRVRLRRETRLREKLEEQRRQRARERETAEAELLASNDEFARFRDEQLRLLEGTPAAAPPADDPSDPVLFGPKHTPLRSLEEELRRRVEARRAQEAAALRRRALARRRRLRERLEEGLRAGDGSRPEPSEE